jgi:hypothetical protein
MTVTASVDDTSSADAASPLFDFDDLGSDPYADVPPFVPPTGIPQPQAQVEDKLHESVAESRLAEKKDTHDDRARAGPPTLEEWQDFFSRVVLLTFCEWYVTFAFRNVPEDLVSDEDMARCVLSKEDRRSICIPIAEFANKNAAARKHGRQVIALFESMEAFLILGMWMSRVNRVARRYKPKREKKVHASGNMGPVQAGGAAANGSGGGEFDPNIRVYNPGNG